MSTQAVEIQILGRLLKVSCPAGKEDALREAAADFDKRLNELSARTNMNNPEQLLMFTGLNVCNELHTVRAEQQNNADKLSNRISALEEILDKALQNQPQR